MCTVFKLQTKDDDSVFIVGKNHDTPDPCYGMVFINQRNIKKTALIIEPEIPMMWKSTWGSITFSQVGKEFPVCGMNEAGLVVEQTTLWNTTYPDRDKRPALKELQWIQYMLDTCSTVDDVINNLQKVRIAQEGSRIQFFVCDETGDTALIEYILGKEVVFHGSELPYPVIANDMYETSIDYLNIHQGYGGKKVLKESPLSIDRFAVTVNEVNRYMDGIYTTVDKTVNYEVQVGFNILEKAEFEHTQWKMIYQPRTRAVWYSTKASPALKTVKLGDFDLSCDVKSLVRDIDSNQGDFSEYSTGLNYNLAKLFFTTSVIGKATKVSEAQLIGFSKYPQTHTNGCFE